MAFYNRRRSGGRSYRRRGFRRSFRRSYSRFRTRFRTRYRSFRRRRSYPRTKKTNMMTYLIGLLILGGAGFFVWKKFIKKV